MPKHATFARPAVDPDRKRQIIEAEGSCNELARKFGCAPSTVWRIKNLAGAPVKPRPKIATPESAARTAKRRAAAQEAAQNRIGSMERSRRMHAIDDDYRNQQAAAERPKRCCGKCRTPYNCGNKGCPCHA